MDSRSGRILAMDWKAIHTYRAMCEEGGGGGRGGPHADRGQVGRRRRVRRRHPPGDALQAAVF